MTDPRTTTGPAPPAAHPPGGAGAWLPRALLAVCLLLLATDLFYDKHPHFAFEGWFGFYAFFGFLAYAGIVSAAKLLRRAVMRDEDYYE